MLIDNFGREIDYLRVSITDRCNFRCLYCMPLKEIEWKPKHNILTFEEIIRIIKIMSSLGIKKVKITGGEPLLRFNKQPLSTNKPGGQNFPDMISLIKSIPGIESVTLTTNGYFLNKYLDETTGMNLPDKINISFDALDNKRYKHITQCKNADSKTILFLIDRLLEKKITVKINCVPVQSVNNEEIIPLAGLAREKNIMVRFIELMPIDSELNLQTIPGTEIAAQIERAFGTLTPFNDVSGNGPAVYYNLPGFLGKIGFINAVTHKFCGKCNRLRLTSEGVLKLCLLNDLELDLRKLIRNGTCDNDLCAIIKTFIKNKPQFYSTPNPVCSMSEIGG